MLKSHRVVKLQIGREFDILSLFLILSRQKCMIIYGGQIPESFAKSKGIYMEKPFTWYSIKKFYFNFITV